MTTEKFTSESGIDYEINCADLRQALELKNAVLKQIKKSDLQKEQIDSVVLLYKMVTSKKNNEPVTADDIIKALEQEGMHAETLINGIKNLFIELDTCEEVYAVIWKCLNRCTYDGERITEKTFEKEESREDFNEVIYNCIGKNIRPFLKSLILALSKLVFKTN